MVPFTFIAIMPTNHQLLAPGRDLSSAETRSLLEQWGHLHAVRSVLSFLASIVYLVSLIGLKLTQHGASNSDKPPALHITLAPHHE